MGNTIDIFGIEIDDITAKESMKIALGLLEAEGLASVELVTVDMLLKEQENQEMKDAIRMMDLVLPGSDEILKTAGTGEASCLKRSSQRPFLSMFLKYLQKNRKRIFLLSENEADGKIAADFLLQRYKGMEIAGGGILPEESASDEMILNEINSLEVDCVLSVIPSPQQELFFARSSALMSASVWLGTGTLLKEESFSRMRKYKMKGYFIRKLFRHRVDRQKKNL